MGKFKYHTLDTFIAVGSIIDKQNINQHNHTELFTLANSKWRIKKDYPQKDIYLYSILAVERKFIIFGGMSHKRKVFTNQDIKRYKNIWKESFSYYCGRFN